MKLLFVLLTFCTLLSCNRQDTEVTPIPESPKIVINIDDEFLQELRPTGYTQQDVVALGMIAIKLAEIDTIDAIRVLEGMEYDEKAVIVRLIEEINALRSRDTERIMFELQKNSQWQSQ